MSSHISQKGGKILSATQQDTNLSILQPSKQEASISWNYNDTHDWLLEETALLGYLSKNKVGSADVIQP